MLGTPLRAICSLFLPGALLVLLLPKPHVAARVMDLTLLGAAAPACPLPTSGWSRQQRHPNKDMRLRLSLPLHIRACCHLLAPCLFPSRKHPSFLFSPNPPFCHPLSPLVLRPLQKCSCFRSRVLALLEMQEEIHVQLTVSAPCNHFVSQKALLSNPHRQTGRGRVGERHLTPACAFLPHF